MNRRRLLTALAVVCLSTGLIAATLVLLGGENPSDRATLSASGARARADFVELATSRKTDPPPQVLLTPASNAWWPLVSGMAVEMNLGRVAQPEGASWFAYSINHSPDRGSAAGRAYPAVYVGFTSTQQAIDFDPSADCSCVEYRRGAISMLTTASFEGSRLDLPSWTDDGPKLDIDQASWTWDIGAYRDLLAADAVNPDAVTKHFEVLGMGGEVTWESTASDPHGPWTGQMRGFDTSAVDVSKVAAAVDVSDEVTCDPDGLLCYSGEDAIQVGNWEHAAAGEWSFGTPDLTAPHKGLPSAPDIDTVLGWAQDRALIWTWDPAYWRGSITQSERSGSGPIDTLHLEVSPDGKTAQLTVRFDDDPIEAR